MDEPLSAYLEEIRTRTGLDFPCFAKEAVHTAPFLAVLLTPANSGAVETGCCSLDNPDPTAKRMKRCIEKVGLAREQIVLWNLYSAFNAPSRDRRTWAKEIDRLVCVMTKLRAIIAFGNETWLGMRYVDVAYGIALFGAPHPSNRAAITNANLDEEIQRAWERAKALLK